MSQSWSELLRNSESSRDFFTRAKAHFENTNRPLSEIAMSLGFSSRSLVSEILNGKRPPSYKFYSKWVQCFRWNKTQQELLRFLIARDYPAFDRSLNRHALEEWIQERKRILAEKKKVTLTVAVDNEPDLELWPLIYAVCGPRTSVRAVSDRCGIDESTVKRVLDRMAEIGLLKKNEQEYASGENHVQLHRELQSAIIQQFVERELRKVVHHGVKNLFDDQQWVYGSALTVKRERMPEMRSKLQAQVVKVVDHYFDPEGDALVSVLGIMNNSMTAP